MMMMMMMMMMMIKSFLLYIYNLPLNGRYMLYTMENYLHNLQQ